MEYLVENKTELKNLAKAGKIIWPVMTNNSKGLPFKYVDEVDGVGSTFWHKGKFYRMKYHSGCFYPYLYCEPDKF